MGKGDVKSKKGKVSNGSFGVRRPKKKGMPAVPKATVKVEASPEKKPAAKKAKPKAEK